jgi:hypothetical protein
VILIGVGSDEVVRWIAGRFRKTETQVVAPAIPGFQSIRLKRFQPAGSNRANQVFASTHPCKSPEFRKNFLPAKSSTRARS